jgi:hypothetical protein
MTIATGPSASPAVPELGRASGESEAFGDGAAEAVMDVADTWEEAGEDAVWEGAVWARAAGLVTAVISSAPTAAQAMATLARCNKDGAGAAGLRASWVREKPWV